MIKVNICGVAINNLSMMEAIEAVEVLIKERRNSYIVTPNCDHVVLFNKDALFRQIYAEASLVLCDGVPILWASYILRNPLAEKISGSDLFPRICEVSSMKGYRIFLMGGRPGAAVQTAQKMVSNYPGLQIVGILCPPFGFENNKEINRQIIESIRSTRPDILFVALGAPKQEKWIYAYRNPLDIPISIGIGATFEFISGMVPRAPRLMQKSGLEWFWRLLMEPKRLWKRYLLNDSKFFWLVIKQKYRRSFKIVW